jgi:hypothetical protein
MRGGWNDALTHAHLAMFASGVALGGMIVGLAWAISAALA